MLKLLVLVCAAAAPVALTWATLQVSSRRMLGSWAWRCCALLSATGFAAAVLLSVLRRRTNWINRELISLGLLGVAIAVGVVLLCWALRPGREPGRLPAWGGLPLGVLAGLVLLLGLPDVLLLSTGLVDPGSSPWTTEVALRLAGGLGGLLLVGLPVWAVHRAAAGAPMGARRAGLVAVLVITLASQLTMLVQILLARRLISVTPDAFVVIAWLLNHEGWFTWALAVASAIPALGAWVAHRRRPRTFANPAQARLDRAEDLSRRRFLLLAGVGFGLAVVTMTVGRTRSQAQPVLSPPEPLASDEQEVWVDLSAINDAHLHRYAYQAADGTQVRFIVIRKNANALGVGLDACNVCGPTGYYERKGQVICKLCDVAMNISTIGFKGGCNPIPIDYSVRGGRLVIARSALEASAEVFA